MPRRRNSHKGRASPGAVFIRRLSSTIYSSQVRNGICPCGPYRLGNNQGVLWLPVASGLHLWDKAFWESWRRRQRCCPGSSSWKGRGSSTDQIPCWFHTISHVVMAATLSHKHKDYSCLPLKLTGWFLQVRPFNYLKTVGMMSCCFLEQTFWGSSSTTSSGPLPYSIRPSVLILVHSQSRLS